MQHILDATKKLQNVIIDGQTATEDSSKKKWKGLQYLKTNVKVVQESSEGVATGFRKTFASDLLNTVNSQITSINTQLTVFEKLKGTSIPNFQPEGNKSVLKMFSNEPAVETNPGSNVILTTYQYYPATTPGTALNVLTTTADKVALNQLKAASAVLKVGGVLVENKDKNTE